MNELPYLLVRVLTWRGTVCTYRALGKARLRGEREKGFSANASAPGGPRRRGEIEGDARSRYLSPCEIERRVRCFGKD